MSSGDLISGGSSPFVEAPFEEQDLNELNQEHEKVNISLIEGNNSNQNKEINNNEDMDISLITDSPFESLGRHNLNKEDSILPHQQQLQNELELKKRNIISLEYKVDTLQNEFELEKLQLQRTSNSFERQYRSSLEELEKALNDVNFLQEDNNKLSKQVKDLTKRFNDLQNDRDSKVNELTFALQSKEQEFNDLKLINESNVTKLTNSIENESIKNKNLQSSIERYEKELQKQAKDIKSLTESNNAKTDELIELKKVQLTDSHHKISHGVDEPTGDFDEMTTINRMFQDQIKYTKELEETNMKQANELKKLRNTSDSNEFWKSEIESYKNKLNEFESLEKDYHNSQVELLEVKSKLAEWEIYTGNENSNGNNNDTGSNATTSNGSSDKLKFNEGNPQQIIRDLQLTKKENIILVDENNKLNLKVNNLKILNEELAMERNQLLDLNKNYENNIINLKRLNHEIEQQKILSFEECKLLRNQLNDFTNLNKKEDTETNDAENNIQKDLESLVDNYKNKTDDLTNELKKLNEDLLNSSKEEENKFKKRKLGDSTNGSSSSSNNLNYYAQRMNELQLENANLSRELKKYQNLNQLLEEKLKRLITLKEKRIRILQLRDNPLSKDQFIKKKELTLLKQENIDLLSQLKEKATDLEKVPVSVYHTLEFHLKQQEGELLKANKRFIRLKEIFNQKSLEFIDVVNSILGFKLEFQQNNKVKIYSCYRPEKHIVIDLVKNLISSNLKLENWEDLLSNWIEKKEQIPCLLATITLQLWEESNQHSSIT